MARAGPQRVAQVGAMLGEGPVWVARDQALWFVDIKGRRVHRFDPAADAIGSWDAPDQVGWVLPVRDAGFLAGLRGGPSSFDPRSGSFGPILAVPDHPPTNRLNDATSDASGRLWFGTMDDGEQAATGRLYRGCAAGIQTASDATLVIANGPAIAPDGKTLYYADTLARTIHAAELRDHAMPGPARILARIEQGVGYPDGLTVDAEGCVWVGLFAGWAARRYAPDGRLLQSVPFPTANVTKIAFGGAELRTAYATTARKGLDATALAAQPAGDLFAFDVDTPGLATTELSPAIIQQEVTGEKDDGGRNHGPG